VTALHAAQYWALLLALAISLALNSLVFSAIIVAKLVRERRETALAALQAQLTDLLVSISNADETFSVERNRVTIGDRVILLPPPRGLVGSTTRELILSFIATLKGEGRERLTLILESAGYVDATIQGLKSRSELRRARAASILGGIGSARALPALTERFLLDPSQEVRLVAAEALAALRDIPGIPGALLFLEAARQPTRYQEARIANVMSKFGASVVGPLEDALSDPDARIVNFALDVLIEIGLVLHPDKVIAITKHSSAQVRSRAIELLGAVGRIDAFEPVSEAMSDSAWFVRLNSVKALIAMGTPRDEAKRARYFRALETALHDERWAVRRNAAAALAAADDKGRLILQRALTNEGLAALHMYYLRRGQVVPTIT